MKKLFTIFAAAMFSLSLLADKPLYLNLGVWGDSPDPANFKFFTFEETPQWIDLVAVPEETNVYSCAIPDAVTGGIFCRVNPSGVDPDPWKNVWNQTEDLTIPEGKNLFKVTSWTEGKDGKGKGEWSVYGADPEPAAKFYITGDSALVTDAGAPGMAWNPSAIKSEADTFVLNLKADQYYILKVTMNGTWVGENNVKGYNELTEKTDGLDDVSNDHNIGFSLKEAGQVLVICTADVFKLVGNFAKAEVPTADYYLVGSITEWTVVADAAHKFAANPGNEGEYMLSFTLAEGDAIKVVKVEGETQTWYPDDYNGAYTIDAAHAGAVTIYFRPEGGVEGWHYGYFYVAAAEPQAIHNTAAEMKAVKTVINGQLVIIKGDNIFNALGAQIQ